MRLFVQDEGRLWRQTELPDPGDASEEPSGGVNLVFCVTGGFVDKGGSEGRVPRELERIGTHRGRVGILSKGKLMMYT